MVALLATVLSLVLGCTDDTSPAPPRSKAARGGAAGAETGAGGATTTEATGGAAGSASEAGAGTAGSCNEPSFAEPSVAGSPSAACDPSAFSAPFSWTTSDPLVAPISDASHALVSIKDPTVVFFDGRWHVYATVATASGNWNMVYLNFTEWAAASTAPQYYMDKTPGLAGYHCAPQLFYFRPQNKWYLVYQSGPPQFSTADDPSHPESWTPPKSFYAAEPETVRTNKGAGGWLDFWVICDEASCYLFFSDDTGNYYRARTAIGDFPNGFGEPEVIIRDTKENAFEASNVYKLKGTDKYLLLIEGFGSTGNRYFRSLTTDRLDGTWAPLAADWNQPFAGSLNVTPGNSCSSRNWSSEISHGELLRDGYDETLTVDPCNLTFLYQGVDYKNRILTYSQIPWRLALLSHRQ
jgi:hypothetical protein